MSSRTERVVPAFSWLSANGPADWATRLVDMAHGLAARPVTGNVLSAQFDPERRVPPSAKRLEWLLRNLRRLAPKDGRRWQEYANRTADQRAVNSALAALACGNAAGIPAKLKFEGATSADCLVECERAFIWVEGKKDDWLEWGTQWDVSRDQLARNIEAAWLTAREVQKEFCLIICHEHALKHHEEHLLAGYRAATWSAGLPHLDAATRGLLGERIGTLTWAEMQREWPSLPY